MAYKFETFLLKEKIEVGELSTSLKKKIADLRKVEAAIPVAEGQLSKGNLSVKVKEELTTKIADSKEAIPDMDAEILQGIQKWLPNREKNAEKGRLLAEARAKKSGTKTTTAPATTTPTEPAPTPPTKPVKHAPPATIKEEEKTSSNSGWGYALLVLGVVVLGAVGIQVHKAMKDKAA